MGRRRYVRPDFRPELVVTDLMMPVMDGVELIQQLRAAAETADLPIVAMTAEPGARGGPGAGPGRRRLSSPSRSTSPPCSTGLRSVESLGGDFRWRPDATVEGDRPPPDPAPAARDRGPDRRPADPGLRRRTRRGEDAGTGPRRDLRPRPAERRRAGQRARRGDARRPSRRASTAGRRAGRWRSTSSSRRPTGSRSTSPAAATPRCTAPSASADLGASLSCQRDFSLVEGFNPAIRLTRTQTLMEGAPFCDFRFRADRAADAPTGRP